MKLSGHLIIFLLLSAATLQVAAQKENPVVQTPSTDSLMVAANAMYNGKTDMVRYEANELFIQLLKKDLRDEGAFDFVYDSIRILSVIYPEDQKFKIFTWNLPLSNFRNENYGLMMVFSEKSHNYKLIELRDISNDIVNPEREILKKGLWYGAVYYQLIEKKIEGKKVYTIIGWHPTNGLYQQKVIDVITFDRADEPVFGRLMFRGKGFSSSKRIIFRYSDKVAMKLRFEEATYNIVKKKVNKRYNSRINKNNDEALKTPKKKTVVKSKTEQMIIFDMLYPSRIELEGQYQYYYPLSEKGNGFYFEDGRWIHRAMEPEEDTVQVKPLNNGLMPD
ncbi:MAG: hypothetical protein A2W93_05930 [Bacteroidetes bacterium GWF2_43_63]|nr:MAG: hypothetical protein A2W94_04425 [Bacteroidetes bacterium GWE2_42_42]OFY55957.1 MAG: hypothetical protein A2W93_05930 [Bacteroidetes bacterium GWF2_43_63]HBG71526.1 hypothetical protein [Bacteroidales bacterium]HCB62998.1 hypothetical protein [Bacteroidales bacterium]HCY22287.1 hypothetical protein [Bacteroidales bacterium]